MKTSNPHVAALLAEGFTLRELRCAYVAAAIELALGNRVQAARLLGVNRRTLYRQGGKRGPEELRAHGVEREARPIVDGVLARRAARRAKDASA